MSYKAKPKNDNKQRQQLIIGGVVVLSIIVFAAVLFLASPNVNRYDYSGIYAERSEDGAFILGDPEAELIVMAWEDFLCGFCQSYQPTVKDFIDQYVATGQARFEFRMLPISQGLSDTTFGLVECVAIIEDDPAAFWPAHDEMFALTTTNGANYDGADFASAVGVPYGSLLDCVGEDAGQSNTDLALARSVGGGDVITGTPAVAWRLGNDGAIRTDIIGRQPTIEDLGALVNFVSSISQN